MKHPPAGECVKDLAEGLRGLGLVCPPAVLESACRYLSQVLGLNEQQNLTRIHEPRSAVRLHLLDSLAALPEVDACPPGPLLDIGTGGGFPGVPLALASRRPTVLLDSSQKKIRAVGMALLAARIEGVSAVAARAEEFAGEHPEEFAVVVTRAVSTLPSLVELASPLLALGGHAVFLKGAPDAQEVKSGDAAARKSGLVRTSTRQLELPGASERRTVLVYEKTGPPAVELPRRVGAAQKRPLR